MVKETEKIICRHCGKFFSLLDKEKNLIEKISPLIDNERYIFDTPKICPNCRQRQRLSFRNERKFYKTYCLNCKKDIITTVSPEKGRKILCQECFENEKYSSFGIDYNGDFRQCLMSIFDNNYYKSILTENMENSPYCNQETNDKDCYLNVGGHGNEKSFYNTYSIESKYTLDNYFVLGSEIIYESIYITNSNKIFFSYMIEKSYNIFFGYDLSGCQNVLFGYGKKNASYIYKNEILSKEAWQEKYKEFKKKLKTYTGFQELKREYETFLESFPRKNLYNIGCENTKGNNNIYLKNAIDCHGGEKGEDIMYCNIFLSVFNSLDIESIGWGEKLYNVASSMNIHSCAVGTHFIGASMHNIYYSGFLGGGNNCFGCVGIKNKSYHILNKAYTKEGYEKKVKEIIQELKSKGTWGEYFDMSLSPFPYNDSVAYEYFPIEKIVYLDPKTKRIIQEEKINDNGEGVVYIFNKDKFISEAILDLGGEEKIKIFWRTKETEINIPKGIDFLEEKDISNDIDSIKETILEKAVICKTTKRPFRIVKWELDFYKKYGIPLPRKHYDQRHFERMQKKFPRKLYTRTCDKCKKEIESIYPQESKEKVYCEDCYNKEMY